MYPSSRKIVFCQFSHSHTIVQLQYLYMAYCTSLTDVNDSKTCHHAGSVLDTDLHESTYLS